MNLYVGNLSWNLTESDLLDLFAPFGEVTSVKIVTDKLNNRSRGFAFVEMPNDEEGKEAIARLNQLQILGRQIIVNESRPQSSKGGGS